MRRRRFVLAAGGAALLAGTRTDSAANSVANPASNASRRIPIVARKFEFSTSEIRINRDETVTLVIESVDFAHGFSVPELNARVDVPPGRSVELTLRVARTGRYPFLCDNFCGEEHDQMTGILVVAEPE